LSPADAEAVIADGRARDAILRALGDRSFGTRIALDATARPTPVLAGARDASADGREATP
jgi:hypothetical protein